MSVKVLKFEYEEPLIIPRTPTKGMSKDELKSIYDKPYTTIKRNSFCLTLLINGIEEQFRSVIHSGYCYNQADIPFLLQPIAYDKHSPFVKNASLYHDFILQYKVKIYKGWKLKEKGVSVSDFRNITSDIFRMVLIDSGVSEKKAKLMAKAVNSFQSLLIFEWNKLK